MCLYVGAADAFEELWGTRMSHKQDTYAMQKGLQGSRHTAKLRTDTLPGHDCCASPGA